MRYIVISQSISIDLLPYFIRKNVFLYNKKIHVAKIAPFLFSQKFRVAIKTYGLPLGVFNSDLRMGIRQTDGLQG